MATTISSRDSAALYPPTVTPPAGPLPVWRFLPTFIRNPIRALPEPVYHEPIFVPPRMGGRIAWVTDPALVEQILLAEHESFPKSPIEKRIFEAIIGDGIFTAEGASWRWQRRTVAPLFRHTELLSFVPEMSAAALRLTTHWRERGPLRRHPIDHDMTDLTFDVLQATIFSGATPDEADAMKTHIGAYLECTSWDIAFEVLQIPAWVWHPAKRPMRRSADALLAAIRSTIRRERAAGWPSGGLMARLGNARDPETGATMSEDQIAHNLLTFAAAGHETTAKALTWTLYLLARAPDWQERLREEVVRVAGSGPITSAHIEQLVVTRQVAKEAMRLYPPAPVLGRMTRVPAEIGGHRFEAGAMLVIPIYVIHRHRKLWDDPDRFDPSRFEPSREATYARTQFMPFGFGPRTCIGMSFAMIEAVVLLAHLVRDARFACHSALAPEPVSRVTLRPKGGMPLDVDVRAR